MIINFLIIIQDINMENYKEHLLELSVLNDLLQRGLKVLDLLEGRSQKEADVILNDFIVMSSILNERNRNMAEHVDILNKYRHDKKMQQIFESSRSNEIFIDYLAKHLTDDKTPVEMKICIMYGIQIDSRLPYVYLDKISDANGIMENEQYHLTLQELEKNGTINKVDYIMKNGWDYSTERADRVLALLKGLTVEEQEVL